MPTLNEQVREIVGDYNELHLKEVKRQKPAIAPYLKLAIDDDLIPDDLEFESAGHAVYFLQIRELEKELVSRAVLKLQEIQGKLSNYLGQASFMGKDVISNLVDKLKTNPLDINFQTIESELKKLPSGESEFVRSVLTEISSTIKGDKVHQSITGVINDLKSQDGTEKDEAKEGEVEKSSGYKIPRDLKDSLGDSFSAINNIFDKTPLLSEVQNEYAKIQEVGRRLKNRSYVEYNREAYRGAIADDLAYGLKKADEYKVSVEEVQGSMNSTNFRPSMTAHPTNPVCQKFTQKSIQLVSDLIDGSDIVNARIAEIIATDVYSLDKKTQVNEVEEGLVYLNALYDSIDQEYEILQEAIDGSPYAGKIQLPDNINQPRVWMAGDGDGNKNATRESLKANINMFKKAIKARYMHELQGLGYDKEFTLENLTASKNPGELLEFLKKKQEEIAGQDQEKEKKIKSLIRKVSSFGYHFAKIDIRHTAVDLAKIDEVLGRLAIVRQKEFQGQGDSVDIDQVRKTLINDIVFHGRIDELNPDGVGETNQMIVRLLGRFELAAKNPEMFDKAIIAEFNESSQIQAVLRILKDTGHKVSGPGATLNITPLAESKFNLEKLDRDVVTAMDDPEYMKHLKATKKIYFMIARSDTVRRNGLGAQFSQEKAIRKTTMAIMEKLALDASIGDEELAQFEIAPYSGGGAALQRGGGRMIELYSTYGRYCLEAIQGLEEKYSDDPEMIARIGKMIPKEPFLTTQGHQNGLMYSHGEETLAAFFSQGVYANLKMKGLIPDSQKDILALRNHYMKKAEESLGSLDGIEVSDIINSLNQKGEDRLAKRLDAAFVQDIETRNIKFLDVIDYKINDVIDDLSEKCVEIYARDVGSEDSEKASPIDKLLINGPWLFTKRGNKSSRASKRGVAEGGEVIESVLQALGVKEFDKILAIEDEDERWEEIIKNKESILRILKQRAIGVESLSSHSGTNVISWIGLSESIRKYKEENPEIDLKELFHISKSFRDIVRSAEMSVRAANLEKSWEMLCPDEKPSPPSQERIDALSQCYMAKINSGDEKTVSEITNVETLCYIQKEAQQSIELFTEIAGHELSPNAHAEIELNRESVKTASKIERKLNNLFNKDPSIKVDKQMQRLIDTTYVGVDMSAKSAKLMEPQREREVSKEVSIPLVDKLKDAAQGVWKKVTSAASEFIPQPDSAVAAGGADSLKANVSTQTV